MSKWIKYKPTAIKTLPERPGVYVLYHKDRVFYVGESENLRRRVTNHELLPTAIWPDSHIKAKVCNKLGEWHMIEYRLIRRLKPNKNTKFVYDTNKTVPYADQDTMDYIVALYKKGKSNIAIAQRLNKNNVKDTKGRVWTALSVKIALKEVS